MKITLDGEVVEATPEEEKEHLRTQEHLQAAEAKDRTAAERAHEDALREADFLKKQAKFLSGLPRAIAAIERRLDALEEAADELRDSNSPA
jgi:hypothetical protein